MSRPWCVTRIYKELGLEHPSVFAERKRRENQLAIGRNIFRAITFDDDPIERGTGRTTYHIVDALSRAATSGQPIVVVGPSRQRESLLLKQARQLAGRLGLEVPIRRSPPLRSPLVARALDGVVQIRDLLPWRTYRIPPLKQMQVAMQVWYEKLRKIEIEKLITALRLRRAQVLKDVAFRAQQLEETLF